MCISTRLFNSTHTHLFIIRSVITTTQVDFITKNQPSDPAKITVCLLDGKFSSGGGSALVRGVRLRDLGSKLYWIKAVRDVLEEQRAEKTMEKAELHGPYPPFVLG